jgi:hypothetical protein
MPLPAHPEDITEDLIHTEAENLAHSEWWQKIGAKNVILYSWGHPKYRRIAEAVRDSGAKVFINLDSSGMLSSKVTPSLYLQVAIGRQVRMYGPFLGVLIGSLYSIISRFYIPLVREPGRIAHLRSATAIGCITPAALSLWRLWARRYAPELVERMHLVPNPVAEYVKYCSNLEKKDSVVAVGRWDDI